MSFLSKKTIDDIDVKGKRVLVRVDFNVPMKDGKITNDNRIVAALPTIKKLVADGGRVILCSHLGKPKNGPEEKFSLAPCAERLSQLLGQPVVFANDDTVVGDNAKAAVAAMQDGDVVLLQNTRFRRRRPRTWSPSPLSWPAWPKSTSTTPSAPPTGPTAPPPASPTTSRTPPWAT